MLVDNASTIHIRVVSNTIKTLKDTYKLAQ